MVGLLARRVILINPVACHLKAEKNHQFKKARTGPSTILATFRQTVSWPNCKRQPTESGHTGPPLPSVEVASIISIFA